ncbi:MAG: hypothetical protein WDM71_11360 [Ferruginibacter sp.]
MGDFDNADNRIMNPMDIAQVILAASKLSPGAVMEEIVYKAATGRFIKYINSFFISNSVSLLLQ